MSSRSRNVVLLATVLALAAWARFETLAADSLFMDEIYQVSFYAAPLDEIHRKAASQQQPPLDYWIGALVARIADSDFALRTPAAVFGVLLVALVFCIVRQQAAPIVALGGALLVAILPYAVYVSQDARPYAIAMALMLLFLLQLRRVAEGVDGAPRGYVLLGLVSVLLLLSRTVVPALVVAGALAFLALNVVARRIDEGTWQYRRELQSCLAIAVAAALYLPFLSGILAGADRFTRTGAGAWWHAIDPMELARAWQAQLEPVAAALALLALVGVGSVVRHWRSEAFMPRLLVFLGLSLPVVHYLLFRATTAYPFRPAYALYFLPLGIIFSSYGIEALGRLAERQRRVLGHAVRVLLPALLVAGTVPALLDHRERPIKTDWRGLSAYLAEKLPAGLVVGETLASRPHWDPGLFGFLRYPKPPQLKSLALDRLAERRGALLGLEEPVALVLFRYRDYRLTAASTIPLFAAPGPDPLGNPNRLDRTLQVHQLTGLTVLEPLVPTGRTAIDLYRMLQAVSAILPADSSQVGLQLASIFLLDDEDVATMREHLARAQAWARPDQQPAVASAARFIADREGSHAGH